MPARRGYWCLALMHYSSSHCLYVLILPRQWQHQKYPMEGFRWGLPWRRKLWQASQQLHSQPQWWLLMWPRPPFRLLSRTSCSASPPVVLLLLPLSVRWSGFPISIPSSEADRYIKFSGTTVFFLFFFLLPLVIIFVMFFRNEVNPLSCVY